MNTRTIFTVLVLGGVALLTIGNAACSSDTVDPFASTDQFCSAKAEAECNGLAKKCGATTDACKVGRTTVCKTDVATAEGQGRTYRSNAVQDCLDSINGTYKDNGNDVTPDEETTTATVCARVFSGSKQANDTCAMTYECQGALICDKGICAAQTTIALKAQCNNAGDVCDVTTSFCQVVAGTQTKVCGALNVLGAVCNDDTSPCLETLRCVGTCLARMTAGGACDSDKSCAVEAPYCDPATKKCRPKYESDSTACSTYQR